MPSEKKLTCFVVVSIALPPWRCPVSVAKWYQLYGTSLIAHSIPTFLPDRTYIRSIREVFRKIPYRAPWILYPSSCLWMSASYLIVLDNLIKSATASGKLKHFWEIKAELYSDFNPLHFSQIFWENFIKGISSMQPLLLTGLATWILSTIFKIGIR